MWADFTLREVSVIVGTPGDAIGRQHIIIFLTTYWIKYFFLIIMFVDNVRIR